MFDDYRRVTLDPEVLTDVVQIACFAVGNYILTSPRAQVAPPRTNAEKTRAILAEGIAHLIEIGYLTVTKPVHEYLPASRDDLRPPDQPIRS